MNTLNIEVYETSESGNKLTKVEEFTPSETTINVTLDPAETFQEITGFGGSFTESSAYLLNQLSEENRNRILEAYFGESGARYSLTRTHMNSSDFSLGNYSYAPVPGDTALENFSIEEDRDDIIPMIKDAMAISEDGFKIISSPWTAPPWMKDNNDWRGGKLLPEYYDTWALFFSKYLKAYQEEGIDIWGVTVENEPLGNDSNWDSMHYTPEEMNEFVKNHLGPQLDQDWPEVVLLGYDQNRHEELIEWVDAMYDDEEAAKYYDGTAVHWYASTFKIFAEELQYAHEKAPNKYLIQTEATVDAEVPKWRDDDWYWSKEATDWGYDWAPEDRKHLHPKYVPVYRYARDMIGTLNNWVDGWIDWNMVLDRQGGPNWAQNWCVAPVIVDPDQDEVYFTPLYYTMSHFSRYIRPGAKRIGFERTGDEELLLTAVQNPDGTIAVVLLNQGESTKGIELGLNGNKTSFQIQGKAIQTVVIPASE
jgi:glucosylceramidase